jgi:hypothetical protein
MPFHGLFLPKDAIQPAVVTKCFWKAGFGMASSSISLTPDEDVDTTCLNDQSSYK